MLGVPGIVHNASPNTPDEWLAYIETYAMNNVPPPNLPLHGEMFCGWPTSHLFAQLPLPHKSAVMSEFLRKHRPNMILHASGADMAQAVYRPPLHSLYDMLSMRMRWVEKPPFYHVDIKTAGEKTFVWIITEDAQSVVLEDEAAMYPSDKLVTQIRML
jgi:hypothetical protein